MNIFSKIGNKIEKKKKERKILTNKYWKLSASERIHYDNTVDRIKKDSEIDIFHFTMTKMVCTIVLFLTAILFLISFSMNFPLDKLLELLRPLSLLLVKGIFFLIFFDFLIFILTTHFHNITNRLKALSKRFKLK